LELHHEEIQKMVNEDPKAWAEHAHTLHDAVLVALNAVDAKDVTALENSGDGIDQACEGCHVKYWYPNDKEAVRLYEERMQQIREGK
jgi:hypothetical protein